MRYTVRRLIDAGRYSEALTEAAFMGDGGDMGYWPDEKAEATDRAVREALKAIRLHSSLKGTDHA